MYNEDHFKATLFWLKIRKIIIVLFFTILFFTIGFFASEFLVDIIGYSETVRKLIIAGATFFGFIIGSILTADVDYKIQRGYYNIAVLKNLSNISSKLDILDNENIEKFKTDAERIIKEEIGNKLNVATSSQNNASPIEEKTMEIQTVSPILNNQLGATIEIQTLSSLNKNQKKKTINKAIFNKNSKKFKSQDKIIKLSNLKSSILSK